jgi:hypothetical protein
MDVCKVPKKKGGVHLFEAKLNQDLSWIHLELQYGSNL